MIQEYRRYRCDFGHQWTVANDHAGSEAEHQPKCEFGHEAITCSIEKPIEDVIISFIPAGRVTDAGRGAEICRGRYYLLISNWDRTRELRTTNPATFDEVSNLAKRFEKRSFEWAEKNWRYVVPGSSG